MTTNTINFFPEYFSNIAACVNGVDLDQLASAIKFLRDSRKRGGKVIVVGNGGSAAMASHISVDLTKVAGLRAINFNEADLLTCLANDYGYEHWVEKALEYYADPIDLVVLISSSGTSSNIVNGARQARQMKLPLITFSGFDSDNVLRKLGDLNFWAESHAYNIVEMTHHIWLLSLVDKLAADNSDSS
jgi:D-sedoheptulose 7-phosphate isomerase